MGVTGIPETMPLTLAGETRQVAVYHDALFGRLVTVDEVGVLRLPQGGKRWPSAVFFTPDGAGGWQVQTTGYRRLRRNDYQLVEWSSGDLDDVSAHAGQLGWERQQWAQGCAR